MLNKHQKGFTLIELMITIGILAIIMAFAVPSLGSYFDKKRLIKGAEAIAAELQFARSHSIASSTDTYVIFNRTSNTDWTVATSVNSGCNTTLAPAVAGACYIVVDDGDGIVDGVDVNLDASINAATEVDTDDRVSRRLRQNAAVAADNNFRGANLHSVGIVGNEVEFDFTRGTAEPNGNVQLQSDEGYQLIVQVNVLGRIRICSPAAAAVHVGGYESSGCTWTP